MGTAWREWKRFWPQAAFLAVGLVLFILVYVSRGGQSPSAQAAKRYLDAASQYDYLAVYELFDRAVLEREMERYGLDRGAMEALAQRNRELVAEYVGEVRERYGVELTWSYDFLGEKPLEAGELEELIKDYRSGGFTVEVLEARRVSFSVKARLMGGDRRGEGTWPLDVTVIRTPDGWSLHRGSMYAFEELIREVPGLARESFGA